MSSFGKDLREILISDPSLNELLDGGIFYEILPDNFDLTKKWIVYSFNVTEQQNLLNGKNAYSVYDIFIKIVSYSTTDNNDITNMLIETLNDKELNNIKDIKFINDNHSTDLEKGIFMNNLTFSSFYVE